MRAGETDKIHFLVLKLRYFNFGKITILQL